MTMIDNAAANAERKRYVQFLATALGILAVLMLVGYVPTRRLGGEGAVTAMFAGCAIGLIGSILGTVPILLTRDRSMPRAMPAITGAMFVRLVSVVVLGFALALTGLFAVNALLLWLVIAHGGLLVADSILTLKLLHLPENR